MKPTQNVFKDTSSFGIMALSASVTFFAAFAMLGAYLHHHIDFVVHQDCSACQFVDALSSGCKMDIYAVPSPGFRYINPDAGDIIRIPVIITPADGTRAPPS